MLKLRTWKNYAPLIIIALLLLFPDYALAVEDILQDKMDSLTDKLTGKLLPAASILSLVYAVIISLFGDEGGKKKIIACVALSIVGFLAKYIIAFFQTAMTN